MIIVIPFRLDQIVLELNSQYSFSIYLIPTEYLKSNQILYVQNWASDIILFLHSSPSLNCFSLYFPHSSK